MVEATIPIGLPHIKCRLLWARSRCRKTASFAVISNLRTVEQLRRSASHAWLLSYVVSRRLVGILICKQHRSVCRKQVREWLQHRSSQSASHRDQIALDESEACHSGHESPIPMLKSMTTISTALTPPCSPSHPPPDSPLLRTTCPGTTVRPAFCLLWIGMLHGHWWRPWPQGCGLRPRLRD